MTRPRPNIVWLVSDHQAHANHPDLSTPSPLLPLRDRMTRRGVTFTRAYSVLPICTPARASMLTGLYPHRHGITENDGRFGGRPGLDDSDHLLTADLRAVGYRCAYFGKWHLHHTRSALDFGFEGFSLPGYGYPYGTAEYRAYLARHGLDAPVVRVDQHGESGRHQGELLSLTEQSAWFDYESGSALLQGPAETHEAYFVSRLASEWLTTHAAGGQPFLLRVDPWGPHPPYIVGPPHTGAFDHRDPAVTANFHSDLAHRPEHHRSYRDYWSRTLGLDGPGWRRQIRRCHEHVSLVESALAGVLHTIDRLGLADNTVVIFTADHGDAVGSNGGSMNKGGLMVEETLRVPLCVCGPPALVTRGTCPRPVSNLDLHPTILELCGCAPRPVADGRSLAPLLQAPSTAPWRSGVMLEHFGLHEPLAQRVFVNERFKYILQQDGFEELYDVADDPAELHNLALERTPGNALAGMRRDLCDTMRRHGDGHGRSRELLTILERLAG